MIFGIIAAILSVIPSMIEIGSSRTNRTLLAIQLIIYGVEYIFVYLHFKGTIQDSYQFFESFFISVIYGIHISYGIYYALYGNTDITEFLWDISYNILGMFVFYYVTYTLYLAYKHTKEIEAFVQTLSSLIIAIGFSISLFDTPIISNLVGLSVTTTTADIIKAVGILVLISVYVINPDFIERLPIQTYGIMAFDEGGNTIAFFEIRTKGEFEDITFKGEALLFTSLASALTSFIKEAMGAETDLEKIQAEDKIILFELEDDIGVAVIAERGTRILRKSVNRFKEQLQQKISPKNYHEVETTEQIRKIISNAFPYVVFRKSEQ